MTVTIEELAEATQSSMHGRAFDDLVGGGVEETNVEHQNDTYAKIRCDLADGQRFYVTVTKV
jgi:hypothetical protein